MNTACGAASRHQFPVHLVGLEKFRSLRGFVLLPQLPNATGAREINSPGAKECQRH